MEEAKDDYLFDEDLSQDETPKYSISCTNIPESLLDGDAVKEHFGKFGTVSKILLRPKKLACIVDYETRDAAERAILNGGAFDGFEFRVTWDKSKKKVAKPSDDPEWLPDPDVAAELASMVGESPRGLRLNRQQKMEVETSTGPIKKLHAKKTVTKPGVLKKKTKPPEPKERKDTPLPVLVVARNIDKDEVRQLIGKQWVTSEDKMKALEMRDRLVRARLAGRRGAISGSCPDMCPERERITRQAQRQVAAYECHPSELGSNRMDSQRAVKQYSRSSADQEEPLSYDLRPVPVLQRTLVYLLNHIMDLCDKPETLLGDWFHFLWDRLRAIRKDITQQALCCKGSVSLVEACARFHAHCAARLVEEPASSFDQRLNTENLSKCLQTLKYMYGDLRTRGDTEACANEPEFRAYVVLLNMQDANFMWEVQQLDPLVQSSSQIRFAIKVFNAIDNNNYIKFFKLVREATYLNSCILMRYLNDVRARALTRMIKSHSPRGMSQFPAFKLMDMLGFESMNSMEVFLEHYGLEMQTAVNDDYSFVILDKNAFCDNSTPCSQERARKLVESKRNCSLGQLIYGGNLPCSDFEMYTPHSSFDSKGYLNKEAILAEDQGYKPPSGTMDEVKNILKSSTMALKPLETKTIEQKPPDKHSDFTFAKPEPVNVFNQPKVSSLTSATDPFKNTTSSSNIFKIAAENIGFQAAPKEITKNTFSTENKFVFSKPTVTEPIKNIWHNQSPGNIFGKSVSETDSTSKGNIFGASVPKFLFSKPEVHPVNVFSTVDAVKPVTKTVSPFNTASVSSQNNIFKNATSELTIPNYNVFSARKPSENLFPTSVPSFNKYKVIEDEKIRQQQLEGAKRLKEEEIKLEEKRKEEMRVQEEFKRKSEEERNAKLAKEKLEFEKKETERKRKELEEAIERQLQEIVPEVTNEVVNDMCKNLMEEEILRLDNINEASHSICADILLEMCKEECESGIRAAQRLRELRLRIITRTTARIWRKQVAKSRRRRMLLYFTPTWLPDRKPPSPHSTQNDALLRMRNFHRKKNCSFKMPVKPEHHTINLFDTVKKSLLKRSQEIDPNSQSNSAYWKLVTSLPYASESPECSMFLHDWIQEVFSDSRMPLQDGLIYLNEHHWYKKFAISVCNIRGAELQDRSNASLAKIAGVNGLIFYGQVLNENVSALKERIEKFLSSKCFFECIPIALIVFSEKSQTLPMLDFYLETSKKCGKISSYKLFISEEFSDLTLTSLTKEASKWLARRYPPKPPIESNLFTAYLEQCIGGELWYRFKLSLHSAFREAFQDTRKIVSLYNEAVRKTSKMVSDSDLHKYPAFPPEFHEFLHSHNIYQKDYEYFPRDWKSNILPLDNIINSTFTLPYYPGEWPPSDAESFQNSLRKYIRNLQWFTNPENITLKIFSVILKDVEDESNDVSYVSWLDVMKALVSHKISEPIRVLKSPVVVYCKKDLHTYRTTPWWCNSDVVKDVSLVVDDYFDDDFGLLEISASKKLKLDLSDEMPEDAWMTSVLSNLDTSIQEADKCHEMLSNIEKNIQMGSARQARMEQLLCEALQDD